MSPAAIELLLADFRGWLQAPPAADTEPVVPEPALDLSAVLAPFVALRHEVNLQTRASRTQLEQNAQTLEQLRQAVEVVRRPSPAAPSADEQVRPVLKTLIDVLDALALARREVLRLRDTLAAPPATPPALEWHLPWWARLLGLRATVEQSIAPLRDWRPPTEDITRLQQQVDALLVGYEMSVQRVQRALEQNNLERIACVGAPFDPETMEVAEVVRDPARSGTEVIGEVRPGYRWRGKLLRYAHVRVGRP